MDSWISLSDFNDFLLVTWAGSCNRLFERLQLIFVALGYHAPTATGLDRTGVGAYAIHIAAQYHGIIDSQRILDIIAYTDGLTYDECRAACQLGLSLDDVPPQRRLCQRDGEEKR